jgi:hypothetical protein
MSAVPPLRAPRRLDGPVYALFLVIGMVFMYNLRWFVALPQRESAVVALQVASAAVASRRRLPLPPLPLTLIRFLNLIVYLSVAVSHAGPRFLRHSHLAAC